MKRIGLLIAFILALQPSLAFAADLPLVIESGQQKQLPASTALQLRAPTTGNASINMPHGSAPSSPNNGDCWTTTAGFYCQINGSTVGPYGTGTGSGTVTTSGSPSSGNLTKFSGASAITNGDISGDCTTSGTLAINCTKTGGVAFGSFATGTDAANLTGNLSNARLSSTVKMRSFGTSFGDTGGSALTSGSVVYFTVPYACTITAWNITVDAGTVTFDIWKIATGTAVPTVSNTITASAKPALSTGTALHSTSMSGWTTAVAADDIFGIQLNTVATAKYAEIDIECGQ